MAGSRPPGGPGRGAGGKKGIYEELYDTGALSPPTTPRLITVTDLDGRDVQIHEARLPAWNAFLARFSPEELAAMRAYATAQAAAREAAAAGADALNISPTPVVQGELEDPFGPNLPAQDANVTFTVTAPADAEFTLDFNANQRPNIEGSPSCQQGLREHWAPTGAQARLRARAQARRARTNPIESWLDRRERLRAEARSFEVRPSSRPATTSTSDEQDDELTLSDVGEGPARPFKIPKKKVQKKQKK
ncbi:hypothetical protein Slin15195_G114720 [Septoria linicola]|uniref:Uncharacterized protein n=1 Tax=Septoria linicola TaxID=215465 RepID=A0A9Q9B638_9PEZI|nr:hypothetical protein Slin14017_G122700 [Septoria linicola]USW58153.1 hypothetical protein Slin15195_G114720 [Septoria linicola]